MNAILALEDGTIFEGTSFGAAGTTTGEVCFNTAVVGYQELLTDPSYKGMLLAMTYTHIGNYGVCEEDNESNNIHANALIVEEASRISSSWRSEESMIAWMERHGVPGIQGVDTRKLTRIISTKGAMRACVTTELSAEEAVAAAKAAPTLEGQDLVSAVTTAAAYHWEGESREWKLPNKTAGDMTYYKELPAVKYTAVVYDFGVCRSTLRAIRRDGFDITVVPASTPAEEVIAMAPDAVFLSNGPGDPAALPAIHAEIAKLVGNIPVYGIGLGQMILAHAMGGKTTKLAFGHHGGNHPVKRILTGAVSITTQSNNFAVMASGLPETVEVTHINMNDGSIAGIRCTASNAAGLQFEPVGMECNFPEMVRMVEERKAAQ